MMMRYGMDEELGTLNYLFDKEYLTREEFLEMMSHPEKIDETIIKYRKSHAKKVAILEKTKLANEAKNLKKSK